MKYFYSFLFTLFSISTAYAIPPDTSALTIATQQGLLNGTIENGVYVWKGVRYAQAPVNELRFRLPLPALEWEGVRDATEYGNVAYQPKNKLSSEGKMNEDCLFLNVWASAEKTVKKPVMFWIHGGGFALGAGSDEMYNGSGLCDKGDVIVVTCNYRIGALGFMFLDHFNSDAIQFDNNIGLYDQTAALEWVRENIEAFGGDPENITIFGESAGANSVLSQMASPLASGKFQKAIVQSHASFGEMSKAEAAKMTNAYLKLLNINADNIEKLYSISADSLLKAGDDLFESLLESEGAILTFAPVYGTAFLPLPAKDAIANGSARNIPLLIGSNKDEVNLFAKMKNPTLLKGEESTVEQYMIKLGALDQMNEITSLYPKYPSSASILDMITDVVFELPANDIAATQSDFAPTYCYRFDWTSFLIRLINLDACHGMELPFVFNSFHSSAGKRIMTASGNKKARNLSDKIQSVWLSFAHSGKPNEDENIWPQYKVKDRTTMLINNSFMLSSDPTRIIRQGWDSVLTNLPTDQQAQ